MVVASDLDRTLVFSRAAAPSSAGTEPALVCVEYRQAEPLSFMTAASRRTLAAVEEEATFVPSTTRSLAQYQRIDLGIRPRFAIVANGGEILVAGEPDLAWRRRVRMTIGASAPLGQVWAHALAVAALRGTPSWLHRHAVVDDLFFVWITDESAGATAFALDLEGWLTSHGWHTSRQGRKLYFIPHGLSKGAAAREVVRRLGAERLVVAGDSPLDASLVHASDVAICPRGSTLARMDWGSRPVRETRRDGAAAGEEISAWFLAQLRAMDDRSASGLSREA